MEELLKPGEHDWQGNFAISHGSVQGRATCRACGADVHDLKKWAAPCPGKLSLNEKAFLATPGIENIAL